MKFPRYHATCGGQHVQRGPALEFSRGTLGYPGAARPVLTDLSFSLARGRSVALIGANGAGKSTLLKSIAGLLPILSGDLTVLGHAVGKCHHQVAYLPQHRAIDWDFPINVERFVLTGSYIHLGWFARPGSQQIRAAAVELQRLQLQSLAHHRINELSSGQQQRVLLARTLLHGAELLLLDEPLNAVDTENRTLIMEVLTGLKRMGKTIVTATHELDFGPGFFDAQFRVANGGVTQEAATEWSG